MSKLSSGTTGRLGAGPVGWFCDDLIQTTHRLIRVLKSPAFKVSGTGLLQLQMDAVERNAEVAKFG